MRREPLRKSHHAGQFKPGTPKPVGSGRQKGGVNKINRTLRQLILDAGHAAGDDGRGRGGMLGYLTRIAIKFPETYCSLLGRILPSTLMLEADIRQQPTPGKKLSAAELGELLKQRGLPVTGSYDPPLPVDQLPPPDGTTKH